MARAPTAGGMTARDRAATPPPRVGTQGTKPPTSGTMSQGERVKPKPAVTQGSEVDYMQRCAVLGPKLLGIELLALWLWASGEEFGRGISAYPISPNGLLMPGVGLLLLAVGHFSVPFGKNPLIFVAQSLVVSWQVTMVFGMLHLAGFVAPAYLEGQGIKPAPDSFYVKYRTMLDTDSMSHSSLLAYFAAVAAQLAAAGISACGGIWYASAWTKLE